MNSLNGHCKSKSKYSPSIALGIALLVAQYATGQFVTRTVTAVDGVFNNFIPRFGLDSGEGTSHFEWGEPLSASDVRSFVEFTGYDALPGVQQEWFFGGQTVRPGQSFRAGEIIFRNGMLTSNTSPLDRDVNLDVSAFGAEFQIDNHPFRENDTLRIHIRTTPNIGSTREANADYIFFPDFPSVGSFRVFESNTGRVPVFMEFGSLRPASFGPVEDPNSAVVIPATVDWPSPSWTESGDAHNLPQVAQVTLDRNPLSEIECCGPLNDIVGQLAAGTDRDMFLIQVDDPSGFYATTTNDGNEIDDTELFLFNNSGFLVARNDDETFPFPTEGIRTSGIRGFVGQPGPYLLAITNSTFEPIGTPITGWSSSGGGEVGRYRIQLTGASFAAYTRFVVPEPTTAALIVVFAANYWTRRATRTTAGCGWQCRFPRRREHR
jgi:hypothetical protein